MDTVQATVEQLIRDLLDLEDIHIGTGDGLLTIFHEGKPGPPHFFSLGDTHYLGLDGEKMRLFAKLDAVQWVRFIRAPALTCIRRPEDPQIAGEESLGVQLAGQNHQTSLSFSFGRLYDEQGEPIAARFALWEELREKYGGRDELRVENGRIIPQG